MKKYLLLLLVVLTAGCGGVSEKTINDILERDPAFKNSLNEKLRIQGKINSLKQAFLEEETVLLQNIGTLRETLRAKKNKLQMEISSLKKDIAPKILALQAELKQKYSEYGITNRDIRDYTTKLKNIKDTLTKKGDLSLSGDEIAIWNDRIEKLEQKISSLLTEREKLRARILTLRTEIRILNGWQA